MSSPEPEKGGETLYIISLAGFLVGVAALVYDGWMMLEQLGLSGGTTSKERAFGGVSIYLISGAIVKDMILVVASAAGFGISTLLAKASKTDARADAAELRRRQSLPPGHIDRVD